MHKCLLASPGVSRISSVQKGICNVICNYNYNLLSYVATPGLDRTEAEVSLFADRCITGYQSTTGDIACLIVTECGMRLCKEFISFSHQVASDPRLKIFLGVGLRLAISVHVKLSRVYIVGLFLCQEN